jgi:hypothetical protein
MPATSIFSPSEPLPTLDNLLEIATRLSIAELDTLRQRLNAVSARRKVPTLSEEETALLLKIQETVPLALRQEREQLLALQQERPFNEAERATFLRLTNEIEIGDTNRIVPLSELARLRGVTLS